MTKRGMKWIARTARSTAIWRVWPRKSRPQRTKGRREQRMLRRTLNAFGLVVRKGGPKLQKTARTDEADCKRVGGAGPEIRWVSHGLHERENVGFGGSGS